MNTLTYKQAFDLITEAYIKGEIKPFDPKFCFCGTLCGNRTTWASVGFRKQHHNYSLKQYGQMERALFSPFPEITWLSNGDLDYSVRVEDLPYFEEKLFKGMTAALEVLRQIHIERGEVIDETPVFAKRQLA